MINVILYKDNDNNNPIDYGTFVDFDEFYNKVKLLNLHSIINIGNTYDGFDENNIRYNFKYTEVQDL